MKTLMIGDVHGKIDELLKVLSSHGESRVLQLGDMGLGFKDVYLPNLNSDFGFIRGNHDSPSRCQHHFNYVREFGMWNGIFVVGGAFSIDHAWRTPGKTWWFNEELTIEQGDKAYNLYVATKPKIMASHEAPEMVGEALLRDQGFRPEKWGSTQSRTARLLQRMFDAHQPEQWFFGHYHRDWETSIRGTHFHCLNELSTYEL